MTDEKTTDNSDITHIKDLIPDPENLRAHNPRNIGQVVDSLHEVGAARSIVIDEKNVILAGNGVVEAAALAGIENVQVIDVDGETIVAVRRKGLSLEQKKRLALFDNRTSELSEWKTEGLQIEFDLGGLAGLFNDSELSDLGVQIGEDPIYTRNIEAPIYEPKGEKPIFSDLYNDEKARELIRDIDSSELPAEDKAFLKIAAQRHIVFNYHLIADYYAHSTAEVQRLMENSALIIIDFERAIELGYVKLSEGIAEQFREEYPDG